MTDVDAPMIRLEPNGQAPVLSYNVPEPTSYSGRNFIDLQLPASYFPQPDTPATHDGDQVTRNVLAGERLHTFQPGRDAAIEPAVQISTGMTARSSEAMDPGLRSIDPGEVQDMALLGKRLNLYRSLYGTLTYNYVDARIAPAPADAVVTFRPNEPTEPEPLPVYIVITQPSPGELISGPHTGATIEVRGEAGVDSGSLAKIEVRIGSQPYQLATLATDGTWTYTETVTEVGTMTISARATKSSKTSPAPTATDAVSIDVELTPPPDVTPAVVRITSPTAGISLLSQASGGLAVNVTGTASDPSGVRQVEVALDNGTFTAATPASPTDWSTWSRKLLMTTGAHTIWARATDNASNVSEPVSVAVTVETAPPPDTDRPTVAITAPTNHASVTGPFTGATVTVHGSASDQGSGIHQVELTVDRSPVPLIVQPMAPNDWSEWSGSLVIDVPGQHVITAKAIDNAGNEQTADVGVSVTLLPDITTRLSRLILVESYRLSSYLGNYGAGKTIKTFSLLPGEKTKISVTSYSRTEEDAKSASSILDSFTQESADDFERSMSNEQSDKQGYEESFSYKVGAEAEASWGWGKANVSGEVSGSTNATREEFAKNISNAVQKHAAKASAKRDVQINTSYEVKTTTEEKTSLEREIANINVGRTLNFVFRQMNQEFVTILHLIDVRIGFYKIETINGMDQATYREVTLPQLGDLLREVIVEDKRTEALNAILHQLTNIFDYKDRQHRFVEEEPLMGADSKVVPYSQYLRVRKDYTSKYDDEATGMQITVPGIILAANKHVLRTEGIIVEALLGQGDGLDGYSQGLQEQAVRAQTISNARATAELARERLARKIVEEKDATAAEIFAKVFAVKGSVTEAESTTAVTPQSDGQHAV